MSEKWTGRIAVCCIIGIIGILVAAGLPDRKESDSSEGRIAEESTVLAQSGSDDGKSETTDAQGGAEGQTQESENFVTVQRTNLYYYNALNEEEKTVYGQICESILSREDTVLETVDETIVDKVFQCVMNDHPDIYYCAAYKIEKQLRNNQVVRITFMPNYHMTAEEVQENQKKVDSYVQQCIAGAPGTSGQYEKVKYVYEYIIRNTEYVPNSVNNQNICSVFIGRQSVCQGYAKAAQYILSQMGIEITLAYGSVDGELHSWNLVCVDGEYYYMDPTWGDAGYVRPGSEMTAAAGPEDVNYEYFLITTQQLTKTHVINNIVPLPACVATRNNYYVREGLYFTSYDETMLKMLFEQAEAGGNNSISFMCADAVLYQEMKDRLITGQEVFSYMKNAESVSYSYNDGLYTLIFWIE